MRVRLVVTGPDTVRVQAFDHEGVPVFAAGSLTVRAAPGAMAVMGRGDIERQALFDTSWVPLPAGAAAGGPDRARRVRSTR